MLLLAGILTAATITLDGIARVTLALESVVVIALHCVLPCRTGARAACAHRACDGRRARPELMFDDFFHRQPTLFYFAVTGMLLGAHARLRRTRESALPPA